MRGLVHAGLPRTLTPKEENVIYSKTPLKRVSRRLPTVIYEKGKKSASIVFEAVDIKDALGNKHRRLVFDSGTNKELDALIEATEKQANAEFLSLKKLQWAKRAKMVKGFVIPKFVPDPLDLTKPFKIAYDRLEIIEPTPAVDTAEAEKKAAADKLAEAEKKANEAIERAKEAEKKVADAEAATKKALADKAVAEKKLAAK